MKNVSEEIENYVSLDVTLDGDKSLLIALNMCIYCNKKQWYCLEITKGQPGDS